MYMDYNQAKSVTFKGIRMAGNALNLEEFKDKTYWNDMAEGMIKNWDNEADLDYPVMLYVEDDSIMEFLREEILFYATSVEFGLPY